MTQRTLHSVVYIGLASFGFVALRFLLVPIRIKLLTSLLDKDAYGTLTLISLSVSCLSVLLGVGSQEFLLSRCPGKSEAYQYGALWSAMRLAVGAAALIGMPLLLLLILWQPPKVDLQTTDYLLAAALVMPTLIVLQRVFFLLGRQRFIAARSSQLLASDAWFLPIIPLCLLIPLSVRSVLWVWLGWMLVTVVFTHRWAGISTLWRITTEHVPVRTVLAFGLPLLPMTLGFWLFKLLDRYVLVWLQDTVAVANYSLSLNISLIGFMAGVSLVEVFSSEFFRRINAARDHSSMAPADRSEVRDILSLMIRYGLLVTLPAAAALAQCGESVILVLSDAQYLDAVAILSWTAPLAVLFLFLFVLSRMLLALNRNIALGIAILVGALANGVLNALLVPVLAERGAALATGISLLLLCVALAWIARFPRWISLSSLQPVRLMVLYAACAGGLYLLQERLADHPFAVLILGAIWCLAVPILLGLVRRSDLALIRAFGKARFTPDPK